MTTTTAAPVTEDELRSRFDAAIQKSANPFEPTEFGERLLWTLVAVAVKTAPEGPDAVRVDAALEGWDLDEIIHDLKETVVRHVHRALTT